jgi:phenylalanyl-tRNA synthetase beta chain
MPKLKANLEKIKKELNLTTNELEELLFHYGIEVEEVNESENYIELDIVPSRLELFSTESLIEHLKYFLGLKKAEFPKIEESSLKVFIDEKNKRKSLSFILENIEIDEEKLKEIIELQEKIHTSLFRKRKKAAIGIYDLDKIKGNIYFKALKPEEVRFVPLKEEKEIVGKELLNTEKGKEFGHLLKEYEKERYWPVFLDEENNILSVPPIINSNDAGNVSINTKNIWVEISGDDLNYLKKHLPFLIKILHTILKGKIKSVTHIFGKEEIKTKDLIKKEEVNENNFNWNLYTKENLNWNEVKELLQKMAYIEENNKLFKPWYRFDLHTEQDIIEDLIIALGINNLKASLPQLFTIGELAEYNEKLEKLKMLMIGLGFLEQIGEILTHTSKLKELDLKQDLKIINSQDENLNTVRPSLLPSFLDFLSNNTLHPYPQKIFEIGEIIKNKRTELNLGFVWSENKITFNDAKQIVDYLLRSLDIDYELKESDETRFIKGRQAFIFVDGEKVGEIGEVNPEVLLKWKIEMPTVFGELYLNKLFIKKLY